MTGAVVSLSGGQDSATCLYWAKSMWPKAEGHEVHAVSFDYGQRHKIELELAAKIARDADVPHTILHLEAFHELGAASLTNANIPNGGGLAVDAKRDGLNMVAVNRGLPASFVPGRNIVLLSLAAAYGLQHGLTNLVTGVCQADDSGYPDCRATFVAALEDTIRIGTATPEFDLFAPLMSLDKAHTWALAAELGILDVIVHDTNTCYEGQRGALAFHDWGYGCGVCPACVTRQAGYEEWQSKRGLEAWAR